MESNSIAPIKVLCISVRSDLGGGPKHLLDLFENTPKDQIEFYGAFPKEGEFAGSLQNACKEAVFIPHRMTSLKSLWKLKKYCQKHQISLIHSHGRGAGIYSRLLKLFLKIRVIHTLHGVHVEGTLVNQIKLWIDRLLIPLTDDFICVSESEKRSSQMEKVADDEKVTVIYNGVKVPKENPFKAEERAFNNIVMVGRLHFQKGHDLLISHLAYFCKKYPGLNFKIQIAGDGDIKEELLTTLSHYPEVNQRIEFLGKVLDISSFLTKGDLFLSSSRFEGFPISVLEALSRGLPCLLSYVTGHIEFAEANAVEIYGPYDEVQFSEKLKKLLESTQLRTSLSEKGFSTVKNLFSIEQQIQKTIELYRS